MATIEQVESFVSSYRKVEKRIDVINKALADAQADLSHTECEIDVKVSGEPVYRSRISLAEANSYVQSELSSLNATKAAMDNILDSIAVGGT